MASAFQSQLFTYLWEWYHRIQCNLKPVPHNQYHPSIHIYCSNPASAQPFRLKIEGSFETSSGKLVTTVLVSGETKAVGTSVCLFPKCINKRVNEVPYNEGTINCQEYLLCNSIIQIQCFSITYNHWALFSDNSNTSKIQYSSTTTFHQPVDFN